MSDDTLTIVGTCGEISERNGWTAFSINVPGKQYPVKLSTKLPALIEQGRAVGDQIATWRYKESQGGENPNKPGTFYTNRYMEGVEAGASAEAQSASPAGGSQPTQTGHHEPLAAGDRERSIVRQTSIKAAAELYSGRSTVGGTGPDDPDWVLAVIQAAARFETWILRDLTPEDDLPF